jgi:hypothetical protein
MMDSPKLSRVTSGFVLAAAMTILINTALACAKDASPQLKAALKSVAGHDWTTQSLIDLALFVGLGLIFTNIRAAQGIDSRRLIAGLIGSVVIAGVGLALWYALFLRNGHAARNVSFF